MNWYTNSLLCDLRSNIESIPDNLSYDGEKLETKEEGGKVIRIFVPETGYFDVTTRKEMRFVEFGPQGRWKLQKRKFICHSSSKVQRI